MRVECSSYVETAVLCLSSALEGICFYIVIFRQEQNNNHVHFALAHRFKKNTSQREFTIHVISV